MVDFTLLTQSKLKNEQISLDLQPLHAKNFLFDLKHNLAPLEDLKFITSASIESRSVLNNLSSFSKLNQEIDKKYQNRWKSSPTMDSNLQNSRRLDYFKFDSKNDLYLIKMQELAQEKTDELVDPAIIV